MPLNFHQIFNSDFQVVTLFRCIPRKYAEEFLKGKIKFSKPINWIKIEEEGNKGQGDVLEGVFLSTDSNDKSKFINNLKKDETLNYFQKDNLIYFRNKKSLDLYSLCLYGLSSNMFTRETTDRFGEKHHIATITKDYFSAFNSVKNEKDYFELSFEERPSVIFITNPHAFFEKIKTFFINLGVEKDNIIIHPVEYVDYSKSFISFVPSPVELFLKDKYFAYQSEIRIVINSKSSKLIEYMEKENWIIDIGDISQYASIYDNYFHDLLLEIRENSLIFTLPFKEKYDLEDLPLEQLLSIYVQTARNRLPDEKNPEEIKFMLNIINRIINKKYKITVSYVNDNLFINNPYKIDIDALRNQKNS